MRAAASDPIIRAAPGLLYRARAELRDVARQLEQHPDYAKTERARRRLPAEAPLGSALTLAWWLHNGTHSTLFDMMVDDAPELLLRDADPGALEASLQDFIEDERRDLALFARRRARRAAAAA